MFNTMLNVADIAPVAAAATQQASASADLSVEIKEQIECVVLFRIPVPFIDGGIPVYESTVVTWIIMAVFIFIAILLTRNLKIVPTTKRQAALEVCVSWLRNTKSNIAQCVPELPKRNGQQTEQRQNKRCLKR